MTDKTNDHVARRTAKLTNSKHRHSGVAILIVDMIADFNFEAGDKIFQNALPVADKIAKLKERAIRNAVPVIYVNDNYGNWKNDFSATLDSAEASSKGNKIASLLRPGPDDYHVLKPQRSGFFATPLDVLLSALDVSDLVITGITTDICVLFTAHDAYMRGYRVNVPVDCCAAAEPDQHISAIDLLSRIADADVRTLSEIDLSRPA